MPFEIIRNDITKVAADAVVNTANPKPVVGGGTDAAVYHAAGKRRLLAQRKKIGDIAPGQAVRTDAFRLPAKYIIHTVGPVWQGGGSGERDVLRACYANSLRLAAESGCESVAFPLIATGVYGFPKDEALRIALEEIGRFLLTHEMRVILVVFDARAFALSSALMGDIQEFIDDRDAALLRAREYGAAARNLSPAGRSAPLPPPREASETEAQVSARREIDTFFEARKINAPYGADACYSMPEPDRAPQANLPGPQFSAAPALRKPAKTFRVPSRRKSGDKRTEAAPSAAAPLPAAQPVSFSTFSSGEKSLDELLESAGGSFQQKLFELIDASGMDDVTVYKKANIDRKVFSRIRCKEDYRPTKKTAVAFAIALELDMETMLDLLARAEIAFSPSSKFDLIVTYFVTHRIYDIFEINAALFQYDQPLLGA